MSYVNASDVLPPELLIMVQKYAEGVRMYIPRVEGRRRSWGTRTGTRTSLQLRNRDIRDRYRAGETVDELAGVYFLSPERIRAILRDL